LVLQLESKDPSLTSPLEEDDDLLEVELELAVALCLALCLFIFLYMYEIPGIFGYFGDGR